MSSTTFTDGVTVLLAAWCNDANTVVYDIFGDGSSYTGDMTVPGNATIAGTLGVTGVATFTAAPVGPTQAVGDNSTKLATTAYADRLIPAGTMLDYGGAGAVPSGFLLCDGTAVSRATYANLFTAISTTWGAGDGSTTFNLPNTQRRVSVGNGGSGTGTLGNTVGSTGGEETHTMTEAELVAHTHTIGAQNSGGISQSNIAGASGVAFSGATDSTGSSTPFNVMQPSYVVQKIIKY